jgi:hypothetical protein
MTVKEPIFIVGWFRSGTSMLWNMFRTSRLYTCYYEPLHEHLLLYVEKQHNIVDSTHIGIKNYWEDYRALPLAEFRCYWKPWFGRERWHLDEMDSAEDLADYIKYLISSASKPVVFKFVRVGFRVGWLHKTFPEARIIHIARNPRAIWTSMMGKDCEDDTYGVDLSDRANEWLINLQKFANELGIEMWGHPYQQFFHLWSLAYRQVSRYANTTWWYEDIIRGGEAWVQEHLIHPGYIEKTYPVVFSHRSLMPSIHSDSWYWHMENAVITLSQGCNLSAQKHEMVQQFQMKNIIRLQDKLQEVYMAYDQLARDQIIKIESKAQMSGFNMIRYALKVLKRALITRYRLWKI